MEKPNLTIRPSNSDDLPFIMNSWLTSYKGGSYFAKRIRDSIYYKYHHPICSRILERPTTVVAVAADIVDPSVILGYLVCERFEDRIIIHYSYVKSAFRNLGIFKALVEACEVDPNKCFFSHWTKSTDELLKKWPEMSYVPYLI